MQTDILPLPKEYSNQLHGIHAAEGKIQTLMKKYIKYSPIKASLFKYLWLHIAEFFHLPTTPKLILIISVSTFYTTIPFTIEPSPIASIYTPNSILSNKGIYVPLFAGDKKRYSTCTGATWFHDDYLAILNLYGQKIITYKFNRKTNSFKQIQKIVQSSAQLVHAENLVVSPDGTLLAVASFEPYSGVNIFSLCKDTHLIDPKPIFSIRTNHAIHNARFSSNGKYIGMVGWNNNHSLLYMYEIVKNGNTIQLNLTHQHILDFGNIKAKALQFSQDNRFIIIAFCNPLFTKKIQCDLPMLASYAFDATTGVIKNLVTNATCASGDIEDILLVNNDQQIITSDQINNSLKIYPFNPETGDIISEPIIFEGALTKLDFPHGLGLSKDGKYLAVTNYGDDKCTIYAINNY